MTDLPRGTGEHDTRTGAPATTDPVPPGWQVLTVTDLPDTALDRWTASLTDPAAGAYAVTARPRGDRRGEAIYDDLVTATGRIPEHRRTGPAAAYRRGRNPRAQAAPWVLPHCQDIVICHAHWLDPATLSEVIVFAAAADARLWLVGQPPPAPLAEALAVWVAPTGAMNWDQFQQRWQSRHTRATATPGAATGADAQRQTRDLPRSAPTTAPLGPIPDVDPTVFAHVCARMSNVNHAEVAALLAAGRDIVEREITPLLADHANGVRVRRRGLGSGHLVAATVTSRAAWHCLRAPTAEHAVALARGMQLALLAHNIHLYLPADRIRGAHRMAAARRGSALDDDQLAGWVTTDTPAAFALIEFGYDERALHRVTVGELTTASRSAHLSAAARRVLVAHLVARRLDGADDASAAITDANVVNSPLRYSSTPLGSHALLACARVDPAHVCDFGVVTAIPTPPMALLDACGVTAAEAPPLAELLGQIPAGWFTDLSSAETLLLAWVAAFAPAERSLRKLPRAHVDVRSFRERGVLQLDAAGRYRPGPDSLP